MSPEICATSAVLSVQVVRRQVKQRAEDGSGGDPASQGVPRSGAGTPARRCTQRRGEGPGKGTGPCDAILGGRRRCRPERPESTEQKGGEQ